MQTEATLCNWIDDLVEYAIENELAEECDRVFLCNRISRELGILTFAPDRDREVCHDLETILAALCDFAQTMGIIPDDSITERDLFDTHLMGILTPRPGEVQSKFRSLYEESPQKATDYYYHISRASDYIRTYRVKKDVKWIYSGKYGDLDITINLSKPEKDPRAIAAAKMTVASGYPKCALCRENEGFAGSLTQAARENLRLIPMTLAEEQWFLQYSPYVYYNEHCIALSAKHTPMCINRSTFVKQLDFVEQFPHYMLGANADLPIVGGSILSHDHMQGGRYTFAMERAPIEKELHFDGFEDVSAGIVRWPMSVIRLRSQKRESLIELSDRILRAWRAYSDPEACIFAATKGEPHNTITPISRRRGEEFEIDLVLRNNLTTDEHPLGVFHPHADKHNIKKENIGLIEVMGLAVLPARLCEEMDVLADYLAQGKDITLDERTAKHAAWVSAFASNYQFSYDNAGEILQKEIGRTFEAVLEDAGVYKCTKEGREAFLRFAKTVK
ncbi:MAG: UDP-glucose--hexose-1-phosphate uridylyltransferase [Ruminococcaceae bacterium]|nr:UDP-glucose--hexose-1-phosphate uridylyltransferase [Oscillospiraceae bacterium]